MPPTRREFWYCRKDGGHVVGEVVDVHLLKGAGRVKALALYEKALSVPPEDVPPLRAEKVFHVEGLVCSICGRQFDWFPTLPSLRRLMQRYESDES